ncbi:MAG: WbqC family protein, partial [Patescibacteria group bacterium]|nr:WbqC family protein [Patescibacteria group bacterium]
MKISIFQPTYLPWIGFFKAIDWADKFVFLDDVKFKNRSWQCRNRIKSANGELMLTVPVMKKSEQKINEVKIDYSQDWI